MKSKVAKAFEKIISFQVAWYVALTNVIWIFTYLILFVK